MAEQYPADNEFMPELAEAEKEKKQKEESFPIVAEEPFGDLVLSEELVEKVERAVDLKKRMMVALLKLTTENDWANIGGNPYLRSSGCEALADALGVSWKFGDVIIRTFNDNGKFVEQYLVKGLFTKPGGRTIETEGIGSTDDDFFSKKGSLPFEEIDRNSVRKKAETNAVERGVSKLLNLRGITWEQLKSAGLNIDKIVKVEYKQQGNRSSGGGQPQRAQVADVRTKSWGMLLDLCNGDEEMSHQLCKKVSSFEKDGKTVPGFLDPKNPQISDGWVKVTYGRIKELWEQKGYGRDPGQEG